MNSQYNRYKPLAHWPVGTSGGKENAPPPHQCPFVALPEDLGAGRRRMLLQKNRARHGGGIPLSPH